MTRGATAGQHCGSTRCGALDTNSCTSSVITTTLCCSTRRARRPSSSDRNTCRADCVHDGEAAAVMDCGNAQRQGLYVLVAYALISGSVQKFLTDDLNKILKEPYIKPKATLTQNLKHIRRV